MPLSPFNKCFSVEPPKKDTIFAKQMAKKCQFFTSNQCFLGLSGRVVLLLPFLRVPDPTKDVLYAIDAISQLCQCQFAMFVEIWKKTQQCAESAMCHRVE